MSRGDGGPAADARHRWRAAAAAGDVLAMRHLARDLRRSAPAEAARWGWLADAAEADVSTEDVPDDVVRAADGLGELRQVVGVDDLASDGTVLAVGLGVALLAALAGAGPALLGWLPFSSLWVVACLVVAGLLALGMVALVSHARDTVAPRIWRFERGLVHRQPSGAVDAMAWEDVRMRSEVTVRVRDGRHTGTDVVHTLVHRDGRVRVLSSGLLLPAGQLCALGHAIEPAVAAVRLPRAVVAIREGRTVDFGPLSVGPDGIRDGSDLLPWDRVGSVVATGGTVLVTPVGRRTAWSSTRVRSVPDLPVLLALADDLRHGAGTSR